MNTPPTHGRTNYHQLPLVDLPGGPRKPGAGISADRRRALRQAAAMAAGHHPLGMYLRYPLRLHPDAAPPADRNAPGLRCRDCAFWVAVSVGDHASVDRKCLHGNPTNNLATAPRVSNSAATDCRGWWPACTDFQPRPDNKPTDATEKP